MSNADVRKLLRDQSAPKRSQRTKKPLFDDALVAEMTPPSELLQSTGASDAAFFEGRLPLGYLDMPTTKLIPRKRQPRTHFDNAELAELAGTFANGRGILEPILCRPLPEKGVYEIVAGERRFRAAQLAGLTTVPVIARDVSDEQADIDALIENLYRKDLSALEEAKALERLVPRFESASALAAALSWDRQRLSNKLRILKLDPALLDIVCAQPARYSWRMLNAALQVQEDRGVDAAMKHLIGADDGADTGEAQRPEAASQHMSSKTSPKRAKTRQLAFVPKSTRQGGFRLSVHAPTREHLPDAIVRLRALLAALEQHAASDDESLDFTSLPALTH